MIKKYKRHNWSHLQKEYLNSSYSSLKEFAEAKELNYSSSQFWVHCKNWSEIKKQLDLTKFFSEDLDKYIEQYMSGKPPCFFNYGGATLMNAELTYECDTRSKPCKLKDIAKWYGLNYQYVRLRAAKEHWRDKREEYLVTIYKKVREIRSTKIRGRKYIVH